MVAANFRLTISRSIFSLRNWAKLGKIGLVMGSGAEAELGLKEILKKENG